MPKTKLLLQLAAAAHTLALTIAAQGITGTTFKLKMQNMVDAAGFVVPNLNEVAIVGDPFEGLVPYRHFKDEGVRGKQRRSFLREHSEGGQDAACRHQVPASPPIHLA